jgi:hypothetical protein
MKRLLLVGCLCLLFPIVVAIAQTVRAIGQFVVVNAAADPPVALTNTTIKAKRVTFIGLKGNRSTNTSMVYVGWTSNNNAQIIGIAPGEPVSPLIPEGEVMNLSAIWLDVTTAGDGVAVLYE